MGYVLEAFLDTIKMLAIPVAVGMTFADATMNQMRKERQADLARERATMEEKINHWTATMDEKCNKFQGEIQTEMADIKSDLKIMNATIHLMKGMQDNQNEKLELWTVKQKFELDQMNLMIKGHQNKSQEGEKKE